MTYSFDCEGIHFIIDLEQVLEPHQSNFDEEDWNAVINGQVAIYNLHILSQKNELELKHIHGNQPISLDSEERSDELECLLMETPLLDTVFNHWKLLELSPQDGMKPSWGRDT